jgi:hypothetical protein
MGQIAKPLGAIPLAFGGLVGCVGGAGVALEVGKWAIARIDAERTPHPVVQLLVGGSLLGWGILLVPVAGQLAGLAAFFMAIGGVAYALFCGKALDEAPPRKPVGAVPGPPPATPVAAQPAPSTPEPDDGVPSGEPGALEKGDYGDQVF